MPHCPRCSQTLPEDQFHRDRTRSTGRSAYCKGCDYVDGRRRLLNLKIAVFEHYAETKPPSCACCGETNLLFLTIDHLNGGGRRHRESLDKGNGSSLSFYYWLKQNRYPPGFRVLCMNCNFVMRLGETVCEGHKGAGVVLNLWRMPSKQTFK